MTSKPAFVAASSPAMPASNVSFIARRPAIPPHLAGNPLVNPPDLPFGAPPFDVIREEHFEPAIDWALAVAAQNIADIASSKEVPSFANTIEALESAGLELDRIAVLKATFSGVKSSKNFQEIEQRINPKLSLFDSSVLENMALFGRVKAVHADKDTIGLDAEQRQLLDNCHKGFLRGGALLDDASKARLRDIKVELSQLSTTYKNNNLNHVKQLSIRIGDEARLDGLPDRVKARYRDAAEKAGHYGEWLIPFQPYPSEVMEYAKDRSLREAVARQYARLCNEAPYDNRAVIAQIVAFRHEKARLLGFQTHADLVLSERMAGSTTRVESFLADSVANYRPQAEKEFRALEDFALASGEIDRFMPWDAAFYGRQLQEKTLNFDTESLRPFFSLERAIGGLFLHAEKLFDLKIEKTDGKYPVYHDDVQVYEIKDKGDGHVIGLFYADMHAREEKRGGAWMSALRDRGVRYDQDMIPIITNNCNYPKPRDGEPTLLSIDEVRTLFHEFGHGLHGLLGEGRYPSLTGTNVKWDFVELPSQVMENWLGEREVLDSFASHHQTGAKLDDATIAKIAAIDNYNAASTELRQTSLGLMDMAWHNTDPATLGDLEQVEDAIHARTSFFPADTRLSPMSLRFSHIFAGGYAAGYYSYHWARVMDADVFERFKANGLYDRKTADDFRAMILSRGGVGDPAQLYRDFMGRDPDPAALLRRENVTPAATPAGAATPPKPASPASMP